MWRNIVEDLLAVLVSVGGLLLSAGLVLTLSDDVSLWKMVLLLGCGTLMMIAGCSDRLNNLVKAEKLSESKHQ